MDNHENDIAALEEIAFKFVEDYYGDCICTEAIYFGCVACQKKVLLRALFSDICFSAEPISEIWQDIVEESCK